MGLTLRILKEEYGFEPYCNATTWYKKLFHKGQSSTSYGVSCTIYLRGLVLDEDEILDPHWTSFTVAFGTTTYEENCLIRDLSFNDKRTLDNVIRFAEETIKPELKQRK